MGIKFRLVILTLLGTIIISTTITFMGHLSNPQDNFLDPSTKFSKTRRLASSPSLFPRFLDEAAYNTSMGHIHERQVIEQQGWSKLQLGAFIAWMTAICLFAIWAVLYVCFFDLIKRKWKERRQPASETVPV